MILNNNIFFYNYSILPRIREEMLFLIDKILREEKMDV